MAVTSVDVARAAGVSQATVSRVLAGSDSVTPATRDRVLAAIERTGYAPNLLARAMKTRRTDTVGVVVSSITNPFYPEVLQAVGEALAEASRRMVLFSGEGAGEQAAIEAIRQGMVDGVLFTTGTSDSVPLTEALGAGLPIVLLNRGVDGLGADQVTSDNEAGGALVAEHLHGLGHRRIGFVGGPPQPSTVSGRERGFRAALERLGAPLGQDVTRNGPLSHAHGFAAASEILALADPPTAIFGVNDITALGVLDAARARGLPVPAELSVVGYDDIAMSAWPAFALTTVRQPIAAMVEQAVADLVARIADPSTPPHHTLFPATLTLRTTTSRPGPRPRP